MGFWEAAFRIVGAIFALALVLFLAWFVLRWVNKRMPGMGGGGSRLIKVLDKVSIGKNNTLVLVRVEDKVLLVGFSDHTAVKLQEFDDPDEEIRLPDAPQGMNFSSTLKDAMSKFGSRPKGGKDATEETDETK